MKGEVLTVLLKICFGCIKFPLKVINRAKQAETNLTDQHKITEAKEKELQEHKEKIKQYEARSVELQQDYNESESYAFHNSRHVSHLINLEKKEKIVEITTTGIIKLYLPIEKVQ